MSSSVCSPLKRAKSTVGVPLMSETVLPFGIDGVDGFDLHGERGDAGHRSVGADDEGRSRLRCWLLDWCWMALPQPAANSEAAARERSAMGSLLRDLDRLEDDKDDIGHFAFCVLRSLFWNECRVGSCRHSPRRRKQIDPGRARVRSHRRK